jgi:hypothetical protein
MTADSTDGPDRPDVATTGTAGMATGEDAGAPGDHLATPPLDDEEQAMLDRLRADASTDTATGNGSADPAVEDGPAAVEAAEDDSVLRPLGTQPSASPAATDPLDPEFREPGQG